MSDPEHKFPSGALDECTITSLIARLTAGGSYSEWDVLAGSQSIGLQLENAGFDALPGPTFPKPGKGTFIIDVTQKSLFYPQFSILQKIP